MMSEPQAPLDGDASLARFAHLRSYCRKGRAPWRRKGAGLVFLSTRGDNAAPDIRMTNAAFAETLRRHFADDLTNEAVSGLATRAPEESARRTMTKRQATIAGLAATGAAALAIAAPEAALASTFSLIASLFIVMIAVRLTLAAFRRRVAPRMRRFRSPMTTCRL